MGCSERFSRATAHRRLRQIHLAAMAAAMFEVTAALPIRIALGSLAVAVAVLALKGFAAAMLGGLGSPKGALVGGVMLGLMEALTSGYLSSQYKDAVAFVVILLVLLVRPQGLLGAKSSERV